MVSNGKIPQKDLTKLSYGSAHYLYASSAASYERLDKAFEKKFGKRLHVTDAYRSYEEQESIFRARYTPIVVPNSGNTIGNGGIKLWNGIYWYKKRGVAVAATPGTSNHGLGRTCDFGAGVNYGFNSPEYLWMKKEGAKHGWNNDEGSRIREPWHWTHVPSKDTKVPPKFPSPNLKVDGIRGTGTDKAWQTQLGKLTADGKFGNASVKRLQERLNGKNGNGGYKLTGGDLKEDGIMGDRTWKAVQKLLNLWIDKGRISGTKLKLDGKPGPATIKLLQKSLNVNAWR